MLHLVQILCLWHVLRIQHLLLKVMRMPELVLLDRQAQSLVVIVAHGQLISGTGMMLMMMVGMMMACRSHYDSLSPTVLAMMVRSLRI